MASFVRFLRKLGLLFGRERFRDELNEEMAFHRAAVESALVDEGMTPEAARYAARRQFGNVTRMNELSHEVIGFRAETVAQDIRFAIRQLRKNPGFAATAILILALGLCANVAIFAFVDAALLKPLPYQNPSRLVGLFESTPLGSRFHLSYLDYLDWKRMNTVFSSVEAYDSVLFGMHSAGGVEQADGAVVSDGFFRTLGVAPVLGRDFRPGEDRADTAHLVVLSYAAWQNRYGGRRDVVGQSVTLNNLSYTIIGVLPRGFHFAPVGPVEFWTTLQMSPDPNGRGEHGIAGIARLKDGVPIATASAAMSTIAQQLARQYPDADEGRGATVLSLSEVIVGDIRSILLLLWAGSALLLLIACVNVSSLLLVRSESRRAEISLRMAVGASASRLIRQFVTEGLTLVAFASAIGVSASYVAMHLLTRLIPANLLINMPYLEDLGWNARVILFAVAMAMATAALFSLMPSVHFLMSKTRTGLTESRRNAAGTVWRHLGANLVVVELCMAMVLMVAAGLLGKSFVRLLHTDIGIEPHGLAMVRLRAPHFAYPKNQQIIALAHQVMDRVRGFSGVQSVAVTHQMPVDSTGGGSTSFLIIGRGMHSEGNEANARQVSAGYFQTLRARLVRGRYFQEWEDASKPRVMIINRAFARRYFPGEDPIGKEIRFDASEPVIEIVGLVDDIKEGPLDKQVQPAIYTPFDQGAEGNFYVVVRTGQQPQAVLSTLVATIHQIGPAVMTSHAETMTERIDQSESASLHRSSAWVVGGFAAMALLLGVVGLSGVIAYSVSQRTREIGVRMALGAQRSTVCRMVLREALRLTVMGIGAGVVGSLATATLLRPLLFGVRPWDGTTLSGVAMLLGVAAMLASYLPARRAASVNPVEALRAE
jgi:macrolide transport system ATP-binding/permease protein